MPKGPLAGIKIVEFAGVGPGPMGAMLLADLGATVLRLERHDYVQLGTDKPARFNLLTRNRQTLKLNLKEPEGIETALRIIDRSDALIEGFRPGVMERLGLSPEKCLARNSKLVYARVTGWGQDGPLAKAAGHDLNYVALSGALHAIGRENAPPTPPLALLGDFGGGGLYLALGVACGLIEARASGKGQVVDVAMVDGALSMMTAFYALHAAGMWSLERGTNLVDSGTSYYDVYACKDGEYISIAPLEDRFRADLYERLGMDPSLVTRDGPEHRNEMKALFAAAFAQKTRAQWCAILEGTDACFAPVLSMAEAPDHPHLRARGSLVEVDGIVQPAPAPRFSRTPAEKPSPPNAAAQSAHEVLPSWGFSPAEIKALRTSKTVS